MTTPQKIKDLVEDFEENKNEYTNPEVFEDGGFDIIIGNPPYVAWNIIQSSLKTEDNELN